MASDNMTLGRFQLVGIPPAPRNTPQIEVTFDIDANGIVKVTAQDKATGNKQSITITASTNLDDSQIDRMVKDAEKYAEEDAKRLARIETRNSADQMVYQGEKLLKELGDKVPADLKSEFEKKAEELKKALQEEDYEKMKTGTEELQQIIYKISEKAYGQAGAAGPSGPGGFDPSSMGGPGMGGTPPPSGSGQEGVSEEDVVDVDFEDLDE
jgi:molecular chaperone DnaK